VDSFPSHFHCQYHAITPDNIIDELFVSPERRGDLPLQRKGAYLDLDHFHQPKHQPRLLQSNLRERQFKVTRPKFYLIKPDHGFCSPGQEIKVSVTLHQDVPLSEGRPSRKQKGTSSNCTTGSTSTTKTSPPKAGRRKRMF
jgi:hypothetical protein